MMRAGLTDTAAGSTAETAPVTPHGAPTVAAAGTGTDDPSGISTRTYVLALLVALVVGFAMRAVFSAGNDIVAADETHTATAIVTLLTTTLVLLPLAGITRMGAGKKGALLAAFVVALCPGLVAIPLYSGASAGPFILFLAIALWLALRVPSRSPRDAVLSAIGADLLVGAAYGSGSG
jgi:hypothetical protein